MKKYIAKIACFLALVLLVTGIPQATISASAENASAAGPTKTGTEIGALGLSVGQGLIDTYIAESDSLANRSEAGWTYDATEWSYGFPKSATGGGVSWGWWKESNAYQTASVSGGDTLSQTSYKTDAVILLPKLPSTNYKFEATFTVQAKTDGGTPNGSFGLVTNIAPDYINSIGGTRFGAYTTGQTNGKDKNRLYVHNKAKKASIGEALYEGSQTNIDKLAGYTAPSAGDSVTLTVYTYNGTNYYYVNGIFAKSFASKLTTSGESLCGIYTSGNEEMTVVITDISVEELIPTPQIPAEVANAVTGYQVSLGDKLIDTNISGRYVLPSRDAEGWTQIAKEWSSGLPKTDKVGGLSWGWWNDSKTRQSASVTGFNTLSQTAFGGDPVILLPTLPSSNYKYEATFTIAGASGDDTPSGSFGLVTNIAPVYTESVGGTRFGAYTTGHSKGASNYNRLYVNNKAHKSAVGGTSESQTNIDNVAGYTSPSAGDSVKITVYTCNGTNYYYVNDIFVTSFVSKLTTSGESLCGLYVSGSEELTVSITDISVKELIFTEDSSSDDSSEDISSGDSSEDSGSEEENTGLVFDGSYTLGNVLYQTDFENVTVGNNGLPEGWSKGAPKDPDYTTSYGWGDTSGTSMVGEVTTLDGYGNVVRFGSTNTDAYITLPATGTMDYLFEATVIVNYDTKGEFGLANNFYTSATEADGCMYNSSHIPEAGAEKIASTWKYRKANGSTKGDWALSYYPQKGDIANLKILSYKGYNYVYWNDYLCAIAQARGTTDGSKPVSDNPGFFTFGGDLYITDVKVTKIHFDQAELVIEGAALCLDETGNVSVDVALNFDKTLEIYSKYVTGNYEYSDTAAMKFGVLTAAGAGQTPQEITAETAGVGNTVFTECEQDDSKIDFIYSISDIAKEDYDKFYTIQPYVLVEGTYYYGTAKAYSAASLANGVYAFTEDETVKTTLDEVFADSKVFAGKDGASLTFTLFSDFHYKQGMYPTTIANLKGILDRADDSNSAFVMSAGDFCNDALGSPELFNTYYNYTTADGNLLKAYNIYGNHELESANNSMEVVTKLLTNDDSVVWGTADGTYDSNVGYYYFESNGFRIVCTDNNYSWNPTQGYWEHNHTKSYGPPSGNTNTYSLGPDQLTWLENVLTEAANEDIPCIIVEHSVSKEVSAIYQKVNNINPGTVLMCISGHTHTDEQSLDDGVFHLVCNTTRNGLWQDGGTKHYDAEHTFKFEEYDKNGNLLSTYDKSLGNLSQGKNTYFFTDPLSAVIRINENGLIEIDGSESTWAYNIVPLGASNIIAPRISSGKFWACDIIGHDFEYQYDETYHWSTGCTSDLCSEVLAQTAHSYDQQVVSEEYLAANADCGSGAKYYYSCVCGKAGTETFEVGEAVGEHSYGEWTVVKEATTTETGLKQKTCSVCSDVQEEVIPVLTQPSDDDDDDNTGTGGDSGSDDNDDGQKDENTEETKPSETEEVIPDPDDDDDDNTGTGSDSGSDDNNDGQKDEKTEETKSSETTATSAATTATGDNFRPGLWVILVGVACLALAALFLFKKKA